MTDPNTRSCPSCERVVLHECEEQDISWAVEGRMSPWMESVFHEHIEVLPTGQAVVTPCVVEHD